jgi:hypothetical protein
MFSIRFFVSWLFGAIAMYLSFYAWHGLFLNELIQINYPKSIFFLFAGITYLVISFFTVRIFDIKFLRKIINNIFLRGILAGLVVGVIVFVVTKVTGISVGKSLTLEHVLLDAIWQCVEQTIGGIVIALGAFFIYDPKLEDVN